MGKIKKRDEKVQKFKDRINTKIIIAESQFLENDDFEDLNEKR